MTFLNENLIDSLQRLFPEKHTKLDKINHVLLRNFWDLYFAMIVFIYDQYNTQRYFRC